VAGGGRERGRLKSSENFTNTVGVQARFRVFIFKRQTQLRPELPPMKARSGLHDDVMFANERSENAETVESGNDAPATRSASHAPGMASPVAIAPHASTGAGCPAKLNIRVQNSAARETFRTRF